MPKSDRPLLSELELLMDVPSFNTDIFAFAIGSPDESTTTPHTRFTLRGLLTQTSACTGMLRTSVMKAIASSFMWRLLFFCQL
jgi:hypothetical protein